MNQKKWGIANLFYLPPTHFQQFDDRGRAGLDRLTLAEYEYIIDESNEALTIVEDPSAERPRQKQPDKRAGRP